MDCKKTGGLIRSLRAGTGLTQKQLADKLNISDKAVSKWECGAGCPDTSLLRELASALGVGVAELLAGERTPNDEDKGNMKRTKLYVCSECGAISVATGEAKISCCGRPLEPLTAQKADGEHIGNLEPVEDELYMTFSHPMLKEHHIAFVALLGFDTVLITRLYAEQNAALRIPRIAGAKVYAYCTKHGLFEL